MLESEDDLLKSLFFLGFRDGADMGRFVHSSQYLKQSAVLGVTCDLDSPSDDLQISLYFESNYVVLLTQICKSHKHLTLHSDMLTFNQFFKLIQ